MPFKLCWVGGQTTTMMLNDLLEGMLIFVTIINYILSMQLRLCFSFTIPKNYVSHFKVRTRLAEFFKHIHPDQMAQAPVLPPPLRPKSRTRTCGP
jgi:hypothetical protein